MSDIIDFLQTYPPEVQTLASETRSLILKALPEVTEQVDAPSKLIAYGFSSRMKDMVCVIMPVKGGVNLGFYRGVELPDPDSLLQGTGKHHRHVRIHNLADLQAPSLHKLLAEALQVYKKRSSEGTQP